MSIKEVQGSAVLTCARGEREPVLIVQKLRVEKTASGHISATPVDDTWMVPGKGCVTTRELSEFARRNLWKIEFSRVD